MPVRFRLSVSVPWLCLTGCVAFADPVDYQEPPDPSTVPWASGGSASGGGSSTSCAASYLGDKVSHGAPVRGTLYTWRLPNDIDASLSSGTWLDGDDPLGFGGYRRSLVAHLQAARALAGPK